MRRWVRIDSGFPLHPKLLSIGEDYPLAGWLMLAGICYASDFLTDGFIPAAVVRSLTSLPDHAALTEALVEAGLWDRVKGGFIIHDYLDWNVSREEWDEAVAKRSAAGRAGAEARWHGSD